MNDELNILVADWVFISGTGKNSNVVNITIKKPALDQHGDWRCEMQIRLSGRNISRDGYGADSIDALASCLRNLVTEAVAYSRDEQGHFETRLGTRPEILKYVIG